MKFQVFLAGLVVFSALLIPVSLRADGMGVAVIKTDGSTHNVEIADIERIDIASAELTIRSAGGASSTHSYADIERLDIGVKMAGINGVIADGSIAVWPTLVNETLNVSGATEGTQVTVYNLEGAAIAAAEVAEGTLSLNVSGLTAGVYIVSVGKHSVKIVKR